MILLCVVFSRWRDEDERRHSVDSVSWIVRFSTYMDLTVRNDLINSGFLI